MTDDIVKEVRKVRRDIEKKHGDNWRNLENYLLKKQQGNKKKYFTGKPQRLIKSKIA